VALPQRQTKTETDANVGRRKRRRAKTEVDEDGNTEVSTLLGVLRPVNHYGYIKATEAYKDEDEHTLGSNKAAAPFQLTTIPE